jgi:cell division septum initiation protein DivIVA
VLRLVDTCVLQDTLHLQLLTEDALTIPSIASHGEPEQLISKMEIEEEQTPDQLETKYEKDRLLEKHTIEMADLKASTKYEKDRLLEKHTIEMADLKASHEKEILKLKNIIAKLHAQLSSQKTNCSTTINDNQV